MSLLSQGSISQGRIEGGLSLKAQLRLPRGKVNQSINYHHSVDVRMHTHDQGRYPANTQLALPQSQRFQGLWTGIALRAHHLLAAIIYYRWRAERPYYKQKSDAQSRFFTEKICAIINLPSLLISTAHCQQRGNNNWASLNE